MAWVRFLKGRKRLELVYTGAAGGASPCSFLPMMWREPGRARGGFLGSELVAHWGVAS